MRSSIASSNWLFKWAGYLNPGKTLSTRKSSLKTIGISLCTTILRLNTQPYYVVFRAAKQWNESMACLATKTWRLPMKIKTLGFIFIECHCQIKWFLHECKKQIKDHALRETGGFSLLGQLHNVRKKRNRNCHLHPVYPTRLKENNSITDVHANPRGKWQSRADHFWFMPAFKPPVMLAYNSCNFQPFPFANCK